MKKQLILLLFMLFATFGIQAQTVTIEGLNYLLDPSSRTAAVAVQPTSLSGEITIPSSVSYSGTSYAVTSLASKAFQGTKISKVVIPSSVTSISNYCFYNCNSLTGVTIPNSVISIGESAFSSCSNLKEISIPYGVKNIRDFCFDGTGLTSIIFPNSVESLGSSVLADCM